MAKDMFGSDRFCQRKSELLTGQFGLDYGEVIGHLKGRKVWLASILRRVLAKERSDRYWQCQRWVEADLDIFEKKILLTSTSIFLSGCNVCIFNSRLFLLAAYFTMLLALSYFFLAINHLGLSAMKPAKGKVQIRPSPKAVQCSLVQIGIKYAKKLAKSKPIVWIGISNKARTSPEISNIKMKAVKQSPDLPRPKQK